MSLTPQQVSKRVYKTKAQFLESEIKLLKKDMDMLKQIGYATSIHDDLTLDNVLSLVCTLSSYEGELKLIREVKF